MGSAHAVLDGLHYWVPGAEHPSFEVTDLAAFSAVHRRIQPDVSYKIFLFPLPACNLFQPTKASTPEGWISITVLMAP